MSARHHLLDQLRIIAAFAVIALHLCALYVTAAPLGTAHWWTGNLLDSALRWCVPFFVMISGALLIPKLQNGAPYRDYLRRRAALLLPFVFWIGTYLIYHFITKHYLLDQPYDLGAAIIALWHQPPHYHLWYLYMIIPLMLIAPLLARLTAYPALVALLFALTAWAQFAQTQGMLASTPLLLRWLEFIAYFMAGHLLYSAKPRALWGLLAAPAALLIAWLSFGYCEQILGDSCPHAPPYYDYHGALVIVLSLCLFIYLLKRLPDREIRWVSRLTPLALGIYLIHPVFIDLLIYFSPPAQQPIWHLPVYVMLVTLLSVIAATILSHLPYARRVIQLR